MSADGTPSGRMRLSVQIDQQYFTKPLADDDGGGGDYSSDDDDDGFGGMVCPISFSGKGTKAEDAKQKVIERRFKLKTCFCEVRLCVSTCLMCAIAIGGSARLEGAAASRPHASSSRDDVVAR